MRENTLSAHQRSPGVHRKPTIRSSKQKRARTIEKLPAPHVLRDAIGEFVVQEHHARQLHYDLRLERDGVLRSWAIPKGMPLTSGIRRLAVQVENHPISYAEFQGTIPAGHYGAGTVRIWDRGLYTLIKWESDEIVFELKGRRLQSRYVLVRLPRSASQWLLFKQRSKRHETDE